MSVTNFCDDLVMLVTKWWANLLPKNVTIKIIKIIFEYHTSNLDRISGLGIVKIIWGRLGSLPRLEFLYYSKSVTLCDIFEKILNRKFRFRSIANALRLGLHEYERGKTLSQAFWIKKRWLPVFASTLYYDSF